MVEFHGSYEPADVTFLLKPLCAVKTVSIAEKEASLKNGLHYSSMLSPEEPPSPEYTELFKEQVALSKVALASHVIQLTLKVLPGLDLAKPIAIVSLARAGTPLGVLIKRTLALIQAGLSVQHYSISAVRGHGVDLNALQYIKERHCDQNIVFFDAWTGKGVIGTELKLSVHKFNATHGTNIAAKLHVIADIAGTADVCATSQDFLIPSAILNATVSGLISRTIINEDIQPTDFHGCVLLSQLAPYDQSRYFVDTIFAEVHRLQGSCACVRGAVGQRQPGAITKLVAILRTQHQLSSVNLVKPGVGEATRVMLRRAPLLLILKNTTDPTVQHLLHLARQKHVPLAVDPLLPCNAVALIDQD